MLDGSESLQCEDVKLFVHQFKCNLKIDLPIIFQDELYTSQIAMDGYRRKTKRIWKEGLRKKDQNAAAVILQDFLDIF